MEKEKSFYYCFKCKKVYLDPSRDPIHSEESSDFKQIPKKVLEEYTVEGILWQGSYGVVLKVKNKLEHNDYAMKMIKLENESELHIMKDLSHHHIINYKTTYKDEGGDVLAVITEIADESLYDLMKRKTLKDDEILNYLMQICKALKYLHWQHQPKPIIHCDIKPQNILLKNNQIKLTDFGVSHIKQSNSPEGGSIVREEFGTLYYLPPEVLEDHFNQKDLKCNEKTDIWGLGVTIYKMIFNDRHPFDGGSSRQTIANVREKNKNWDFSNLKTPGFKDIIESILHFFKKKIIKFGNFRLSGT